MKKDTIQIGGKQITIETGEIARQASGAVIIRQGDTVVLVTAVAAEEAKEGMDFFPLTVEYREKSAAAGRIPGGFIKRENRPKDHEILNSRLIDRSIRPLFPKDFRNETQIIATVFSFDENAEPGPLCILGACAALTISNIPWDGPVCGMRLVQKDGKFVICPSLEERQNLDLDLMISYSNTGLIMVEGLAQQIAEPEVLKGFEFAHKEMQSFFDLMETWKRDLQPEKMAYEVTNPPEVLVTKVKELAEQPLLEAITTVNKKQRGKNIRAVQKQVIEKLTAEHEEEAGFLPGILDEFLHNLVRDYMVKNNKRIDGRNFDTIREITGKTAWLPSVHGSSLFTRGETQAIVTCTLGTGDDEQNAEDLHGEAKENFFLHYNFPPFCVGEARPLRGPGRREIGHGNLATRALIPVIPSKEKFPYTIRVVSDITESNGSSSMATVCGGALAMMDAGVPIEKPVAGVAMGLIKQGEHIIVLSDIMGDEDHLGDMDFKVTGTESGVTAIQLDNKIGSLPIEILQEALEQAKKSRIHILDCMAKIMEKPREELPPHAPRVASMVIRKDRIRDLIGSGGRNIQDLQSKHKVQVDIDSDTGKVKIFAKSAQSLEDAKKRAFFLAGDVEMGKYYNATVVATKKFGAFVKVLSNTEGLVPISEIAPERINRVEDYLREGDKLIVKVIGVDKYGKITFTRKGALNVDASQVQA